MSRRFQRTIEDFTCGNCGRIVQGTGYTNHCPRCLWSKHVDINPGDRLASCGGLMEPIAAEGRPAAYRILHHCKVCGFENWNKAAVDDDFQQLLALIENYAKRTLGY